MRNWPSPLKTRDVYQAALTKAGYQKITTDIAPLKKYYAAETYHQDYLKKNPNGYCGLGGTGVKFPVRLQPRQTRQWIASRWMPTY